MSDGDHEIGSGGMTSAGITYPGITIPSTTTTMGGTWSTGTTTTLRVPQPKMVDLPTKLTKKVLIAFLNEDDEPVWAKKLIGSSIDINFDEDGSGRMTLELSLLEHYND